MSSVSSTESPVNPMPIDTTRLQRDVAFHQAAQTLANAVLVRRGDRPRPLTAMDPHEREWFKQTSRQLIEIFEQQTTGKAPDHEIRDAEEQQRQARQRDDAAREHRLAIERSRARLAAGDRGHELGVWHAAGPELGSGVEHAECYACRRGVTLDLHLTPAARGAALTEGCLTAASKETR